MRDDASGSITDFERKEKEKGISGPSRDYRETASRFAIRNVVRWKSRGLKRTETTARSISQTSSSM